LGHIIIGKVGMFNKETYGKTPFHYFYRCTNCSWEEIPSIFPSPVICPECGSKLECEIGRWNYIKVNKLFSQRIIYTSVEWKK
jgi:hypothetical protein